MAAADGVNRPEGAGRKPRQQVLDNGGNNDENTARFVPCTAVRYGKL